MLQSSLLRKGEKFVDAQLPAMKFYMCAFDMVKDVSSLSNLTYSQNVCIDAPASSKCTNLKGARSPATVHKSEPKKGFILPEALNVLLMFPS